MNKSTKIHIDITASFFTLSNNKTILLDTNFFIDALLHLEEFESLILQLKTNGTRLITIEPVIIEFLKGLPNKEKFDERIQLISKTADEIFPVSADTLRYSTYLVEQYGEDGKGMSVVDIILGGIILEYRNNLLLLTKNTTDFPTNIFAFKSYFHLVLKRAIQVYALYGYEK